MTIYLLRVIFSTKNFSCGVILKKNKSAVKRDRTSQKNRIRNRQVKSSIKTALKTVLGAAEKEKRLELFKNLASVLDKSVKKGVIHRNKAARTKSRIWKTINCSK